MVESPLHLRVLIIAALLAARAAAAQSPVPPPMPAGVVERMAWMNLVVKFENEVNRLRTVAKQSPLWLDREVMEAARGFAFGGEKVDAAAPAGADARLWHRVFSPPEVRRMLKPGSTLLYAGAYATVFPWYPNLDERLKGDAFFRLAEMHYKHPEIGPLLSASGYNVYGISCERGAVKVGGVEHPVVRLVVVVARKDFSLEAFAATGSRERGYSVSGRVRLDHGAQRSRFHVRLMELGPDGRPTRMVDGIYKEAEPTEGRSDPGFDFSFSLPKRAAKLQVEMRRYGIDEVPAQRIAFRTEADGAAKLDPEPYLELPPNR